MAPHRAGGALHAVVMHWTQPGEGVVVKFQVSCSGHVVPHPPNRTTLPELGSYVAAAPNRADGSAMVKRLQNGYPVV